MGNLYFELLGTCSTMIYESNDDIIALRTFNFNDKLLLTNKVVSEGFLTYSCNNNTMDLN